MIESYLQTTITNSQQVQADHSFAMFYHSRCLDKLIALNMMLLAHCIVVGEVAFVGGARLPSILRLASCFSAKVGFSFLMSGVCGAWPIEWPMDMPTRIYRELADDLIINLRFFKCTKVSRGKFELSVRSESNMIVPGSNSSSIVLPPAIR